MTFPQLEKIEMIELGEYSLRISETVIQILKKFQQKNWATAEAGGILLGEVDGKNIFITKASIPTKFDKRSNFLFIRQKDVAQILVDYEFYNSTGKIIYLGEWHTHAQKKPTPSGQDINMIQEQFKYNILNEPFVLMIIFGLSHLFVGLYDGKEIYHCHIEIDQLLNFISPDI